jgi:hypothetical protein
MKPLKVASVILLALALTCLSVTVAAAEEGGNPTILPEPTPTSPLKFTSTAGQISIENAGSLLLECSSGTSQGEFTSKRLGTITMVFKGCVWMNLKCQNKGGEAGVISFTKASAHLVALKVSGVLRLGIVITLPKAIPVECWLGTEFRGSLLGLVDGSLEKTKSLTFLFHRTLAKQELKECELDKEFCLSGGLPKKLLLEALKGSTFVEMGVAREDTVTLGSEATFDF